MATNENTTETAEKPTVTAKDMKYLLALLLHDTINDKEKIPFEKAKTIIDLILSPSGDGGDNTESSSSEEEEEVKRERMIESKLKDSGRMEDLGLGRGVDATKPHPWQSKSSIQVRTINKDCENIIGTEEGGQREYYEEEVNSVLTQQLKTSLTIQEPSNSLTIGVEAEKSRSFTDTRKAVGEKVMTRTVSFRTNIDENETLEKELSKFILDRLQTRQKWEKGRKQSTTLDEEGVENNHLEHLRKLIHKLNMQSDDLQLILWFCYDFIEHLGVTHYVHTIKLGAARYRVLTTEEYYSKLEGSVKTGFEVNKVAKAELKSSAGHTKRDTHTLTKLSEIGRIKDDHTVEMKSPDEAVLEVELKPLHSLIQTRALQLAVKWALERYIKRRESRREGPFLISCGFEKPIYWHIVKSKVMGTTDREQASLFYVIPTDDARHPHEFFIGYVGDNMAALQLPKGPTNPISKIKHLAPIPQYITAELNMRGQCDGPLEVSTGAQSNRARFSLHSSVLRKSAVFRTSVDTGKWAEGGGCFINCARRRFKRDGYIAITTAEEPESTHTAGNKKNIEIKESQGAMPLFKTACVTSTKKHNSKDTWMVFRLLPGEHKELGKKPLEDLFYLRDDRDFRYLFGEVDGKTTPTGGKCDTSEKSSEVKKAPSTLNQQTETIAEVHESPL